MAASLFSVVPVRLYQLAISLQAEFTSGMTGYGTSIGEVAANIIQEYEEIETVADLVLKPISGFEAVTSPIMVIVCIIMMAYAVIKVFFANLKRGGILLIQIAVGSLYMFSIPRGGIDAFVQWMKQVIGVCLTAFLQATILIAGLLVFKEHALLGIGLMLSSSEITRIAGAFGLDTEHESEYHERSIYGTNCCPYRQGHSSGGEQVMLTLGSLFDGIGGFPLAAVNNGIVPLWASEIEPFPIAVTSKHFPQMLHLGDITKLNGAELPPVDIIAGGSPCQDLSIASGTRAGLAGARSGLLWSKYGSRRK